MALTCHGLIIIASEVLNKYINKYSTTLVFQIASDNSNGTTVRYNLSLTVNNDMVAEIESKIQVGTICEIVSATLVDSSNTIPNTEVNTNPISARLTLKVNTQSFKFLKPCVYYPGIKKITEKESE